MNAQGRAGMKMARIAFWNFALGNNTKLSNLAKAALDEAEKEITALREALAQPQEPAKKWVGLTDEEYEQCCQGSQPLNIRVRMVAMALKNKNTGA